MLGVYLLVPGWRSKNEMSGFLRGNFSRNRTRHLFHSPLTVNELKDQGVGLRAMQSFRCIVPRK